MQSIKKKHKDVSGWASDMMSAITGQPPPADLVERVMARQAAKTGKNPAAVALGRLGGKKGGKARAKALSPANRKAIAKAGAAARWRHKRGDS